MKRRWLFIGALALGLILVLAVGVIQAQESEPFSHSNTFFRPQQQCLDTYEPNDDFDNAWFLSPGIITSFICCDVTDYDYFKFSVDAGDLIDLKLYDLPADYNLCLFDPFEAQMACSDNGGTTAETITETASSSGDHYALVYGMQGACDSDNSYTFEVQVTEPKLPDLIITDVWEEGGDVCYQIMNIGEEAASAGHYTALSIDGQAQAPDLVDHSLTAGERSNRCFGSGWQCSWPEGAIEVCADVQGSVVESDETNNCITETWRCDTTPPKITSGPVVSDVLQTSAVISWTTDEDSDSVVKFGRYAGKYESQQSDPTPSKDHQIPLKNLEPATVYRYVVESTDASSNTVASKERFFETAAPPAGELPGIASPTVTRVAGTRELYRITVPVSDTVGIGRVEFYLDGKLIGTDYSAALSPKSSLGVASTQVVTDGTYMAYLAPSVLKLSRASFFATQHTIMAKAFSRSGLMKETSVFFAPDFEFADINLRVWPNYHPTRYVDGVGGTLPAGTTIEVSVRASEDEWECVGVFEMCGEVEHAVARVEFEVDGVLVYTSYPSDDDDFDHFYSWDVGGLGVGTYRVGVRAYAQDGGTLLSSRTLTVEPGTPSLEVSRSVSRVDNYFRVSLTLENEGTASAGVSHIRDNVTGLQPIAASTENYEVTPEYFRSSRHCDVEIDVFDGGSPLMLAPDESTSIEYLAVPILYDDSDTFEYGIGARDELKIWDQGGFCRWRLDRPGDVTTGGELLVEAIGAARASADYLLVTHPRNLFLDNSGNTDDVYELLSKMAELAQHKSGILGYVSVGGADSVLDQILEWGDGMKGGDGVDDHFLSNGYVLLVGEVEILGSWESTHELWVDGRLRDRTVHYTDLPYGNTSGDWVDPELIVGRVVGNNAQELMTPLQTSISVHRDEPNYHFTKSRALVVSGRGDGVTSFEANVDEVSRLLRSVGSPFAWGSVTTKKQRYVEDTEGLDITWVFTSNIPSLGRDLIYYRDHCGAFGWGDGTTVIDTGYFPLDFGERKPFVFACCCQAGRYEALGARGIAEAFLQNEAGVYIGATENSRRSQNDEASEWFFDRWADRSESIGQSFRELNRHLDGREGWYWAAEYNLYGDPKYGAVSTVVGLAARAEMAAEPITSVNVVVPDYEVTTTVESEHLVRIPGEAGGLLLEEGKPIVPVFYEEIDYAPGYRVQDVALTARSGLTTATGLDIAVTSVATDSTATAPPASLSDDGAWWPALEQVFDWSVRENSDGSSTLVIKMYPFYYNAATTNVQFYKNYSFTVQVISSTVQITSLATDENVYAQGDEVLVDLSLDNTGDAQDVIVDAVVKTAMGDVVDGLLLQSLKGLSGTASFSVQWDSTGSEPGYYSVEAEVRDGAGNVLDRKMEQFRLGIYAGEVITFTAGPTFFDVGDTIDISLVFSNTGTVPLTGTAIIRVQDDAGEVVEEFSHDVANLAVAESIRFDDAWDTFGAAEGAFTVIGYVLYDSRATSIGTVVVSTEAYIYLPMILKSG
jgi:hypothetical protein